MTDILATTQTGLVRGRRSETHPSVLQFHGIPYAEPPVGRRRFARPEAKEPWTGVWDGTRRGAIFPQGPSDLDRPMGPTEGERWEGALTLSVSTPSVEGARPVALWLHGGANCYGGGDVPWYDGASLAANGDMVVVNVNYRLGALGLLHYPGLNEENLAQCDQLAALRWVRANIAAFGGDPNRVTVFGQSAGGNAVIYMLAHPDAEGLFQRAVMLSPSIGRGHHTMADAHRIGRAVLLAVGVDPEVLDHPEELRKAVEKLSPEAFLAGTDRVMSECGPEFGGMIFKPVMDAWHTPEETIRAAVEGAKRRGIPMVLGTTRDEFLAFSEERSPEALKALKAGQRARFDGPDYAFAEAAADAGCEIRKMRFDWTPAPDAHYGACHCIDLPFLFGTTDTWKAPMLAGGDTEAMRALSRDLQRAFTRFVHGDAPCDDWPRFTREEPMTKRWDGQANPVTALRLDD